MHERTGNRKFSKEKQGCGEYKRAKMPMKERGRG